MESQNLRMNPGWTTYYVTLGSLFSLPAFPYPSTSRKYHQPQKASVIEVVIYKTANIVPGIYYLFSKYDFPF